MVVSLALVGAVGVGSTMAYLTSSDSKTNTFTVGKVNISLAEDNWDADSADHILVPNKPLDKDPTVTVAADSEESYVFVKVAASDAKLYSKLNYDINSNWTLYGSGTNFNVYKYNSTVEKSSTNTELPALFTTATIDKDATSSDLTEINNGDKKVTVSAFAIQANYLASGDLDAALTNEFGSFTKE